MAEVAGALAVDEVADFEVGQLMDAEDSDEIQAYTARSDYDNLYAAIARKSMRRAQMLDENLSIARTIKKVMIGIQRYAVMHHCRPNDLSVSAKMTLAGRIVVSIKRV